MLLSPLIRYAAIPLFLTGNVLVLTSMWALGVTGTYLGDYFGIRTFTSPHSFLFSPKLATSMVGNNHTN